ncbi:MAG: GGDEF domain-containing protein [Planctomycetota bacterium]
MVKRIRTSGRLERSTPGGQASDALSVVVLGEASRLVEVLNCASCGRIGLLSVVFPRCASSFSGVVDAVKPDVIAVEERQLGRLGEYLGVSEDESLEPPLVCVCDEQAPRLDVPAVRTVSEYATMMSASSALDALGVIARGGRRLGRSDFYRALVVGGSPSMRSRAESELVDHELPGVSVMTETIDGARQWMARHRFDVVVLLDGASDQGRGDAELVRFMKELDAGMPIVATGAAPALSTVKRLYRLGCAEVLIGEEAESEETLGNTIRRVVAASRESHESQPIESLDVLRRLESEHLDLVRAARVDSMTSLPNRDVFDDALRDHCRRAEADERSFALAIVDLDNFKSMNDACGHAFGDDALREAGRAMLGSLPPEAMVCRIGGDEFGVLLEGVTCDDAMAHCERLRLDVAAASVRGTPLSVSVGVSCVHSGSSCTPESVFDASDAALYAAKAQGRNMVAYRSYAMSTVD